MSRHSLKYIDMHPTPQVSKKSALGAIWQALGALALVGGLTCLALAYFDVLFV